MNNSIVEGLIKELCRGFEDVLLTGLEEENERFPYTIATIDFISTLYKKGIYTNLNDFSNNIFDNINRELTEYLAR